MKEAVKPKLDGLVLDYGGFKKRFARSTSRTIGQNHPVGG
jgi:hypothetical protein